MSIGLAGFQTGIAIGKQGTNGTHATAFLNLPAEDSDSLDFNQQYIERNPVYGARTRTGDMHQRDAVMPGGQGASWAVGFDGTSLALNYLLRNFFQNYTIDAGTGYTWTFYPSTTNQDSIADYMLLTAVQVSGLSGDTNLWLKDTMTMGLAGAYSVGNAMTLKPTMQSLSASLAGTPTGWSSAPTSLSLVGAAEQAWVVGLSGTDYTVYPSDLSWDWSFNAEDHGAAGKDTRARMTPNAFTGNCSLTVPRNSDYHAIIEGGDTTGTITCTITPGVTTGSGSPVTSVLRQYGKILRSPKPAGATGDVTGPLEMVVHNVRWTLVSDVGSAAI